MKNNDRKFNSPPRTRKELLALHSYVIKKMKSMSADDLFATMVRAGIYTKAGRLTKRYGG